MTTRRPTAPPPHLPGYQYPGESQHPAPGQYYPGEPSYGHAPGRGPRPPHRASPPRRSSPVLLGLVYGAIGLLAIAVAAVTFVVMSPPTDLIRNQIVTQVKAATGRDLQIAGPASFTIFPTVGLRVSDVTLSPPPGMDGPPFLTAQSIDVGVRLLPLLRREIAVDRLVLHQPVFDLRVDASGRRSWKMALGRLHRALRRAEAPVDAHALVRAGFAGPAHAADISELSLGDIRIVDGTASYRDERNGKSARFDAINVSADLPSIVEPLAAKGSFVWADEKVDFDGTLTAPQDVLADQPARLRVNLAARPVTASYDGMLTLGDVVDAEGAIKADAPSLRALAAWFGGRLPAAQGFNAVSVEGDLNARGKTVRLNGARIMLDGATATGTIAVDTSPATRPYVTADLKVADLDLANYAASGDGRTGGAQAPAPTSAPVEQRQEPRFAPQSIEDLLDGQGSATGSGTAGPQVRGYTQRTGWSVEPIETAALGAADVDAKLAVSRLSYGDIKVDGSQLTVGLKDRVLKTTFADVRLYYGRGKGFVTLDGRGNEAALSTNFALSGIAAEPLLRDAAGLDWLAGTGDLTFALAGRGANQAAIVSTLQGKADIAVHNGAIIGFNLGGAMRSLSEGRIPNFRTSTSEKTDFSQLVGTFKVTDGVAFNEDLRMASPLLRATGAGTVDLPQRSLDYTLRPKLVASVAGQGGEQNLAGLEIPVHVSGPWEEPNVQPDLAGVMNNPGAVEAVKEIGKELKGKNAGEIVDDLFGKKEDGQPSKAEKLLQKFLGR